MKFNLECSIMTTDKTYFSVKLAGKVVATGSLPGKETAENCLQAFLDNPARFNRGEAFTMAQQCGYFKLAA